MTQERLFVA